MVMTRRVVLFAGTASIAACTVRYVPVPSEATVGAPAGGALVGGAVVGGVVVGGAVVGGAVVGGAVVPPTPPVHAVPLRVKLAGAGLLPVHEPLKPKLTLPLVAMPPL